MQEKTLAVRQEFRQFLTDYLVKNCGKTKEECAEKDLEDLDAFFLKNAVITDPRDLCRYIMTCYPVYDTELSSALFDIDVKMPEKDILQVFAFCQDKINGDSCVRIENGVEMEELIPDGEYEDLYEGNCRDFLDQFHDERFHRFVDEEEETDFVY